MLAWQVAVPPVLVKAPCLSPPCLPEPHQQAIQTLYINDGLLRDPGDWCSNVLSSAGCERV